MSQVRVKTSELLDGRRRIGLNLWLKWNCLPPKGRSRGVEGDEDEIEESEKSAFEIEVAIEDEAMN